MGTNYYHYSHVETTTCCECGTVVPVKRHIGKSSAGWCFSLHVGDGCPETWEAWLIFLRSGGTIKDEYGEVIHLDDLIRTVTQRRGRARSADDIHMMRQNHAVHGPYGLWRHQIVEHCIGHGDGTYDLIKGWFA